MNVRRAMCDEAMSQSRRFSSFPVLYFMDVVVVPLRTDERQQFAAGSVLIAADYLSCRAMERHPHYVATVFQCFSRYVFQIIAYDIRRRKLQQVAHPQTCKALENEYVPLHLHCRMRTQIKGIKVIPLLDGEILGRAVHFLRHCPASERIVFRQPALDGEVEHGTQAFHHRNRVIVAVLRNHELVKVLQHGGIHIGKAVNPPLFLFELGKQAAARPVASHAVFAQIHLAAVFLEICRNGRCGIKAAGIHKPHKLGGCGRTVFREHGLQAACGFFQLPQGFLTLLRAGIGVAPQRAALVVELPGI